MLAFIKSSPPLSDLHVSKNTFLNTATPAGNLRQALLRFQSLILKSIFDLA